MKESNILTAKNPFSMLAKPSGPICNIDCSYCFYLDKSPTTSKFHPNLPMCDNLLSLI